MQTNCSYCGCLLRYRARTVERFLVSPEQRRKIIKRIVQENLSREASRSLLAADGIQLVWGLSFACPGCGSTGAWGKEYTREDAQRRAEEQNVLVETPEARHAAEHWEDEVGRRTAEDSRNFGQLFAERFPQWDACLEPRENEGLLVKIPSENAAVTEPLHLETKNGEVLIQWLDGWHVHVCRRERDGPGSLEHLYRALDTLAQLVDEELVTVVSFVEGRLVGGGTVFPRQELEWRGKIDRVQLRSWRGSHDRIVVKPSETL